MIFGNIREEFGIKNRRDAESAEEEVLRIIKLYL
jgi:hypothetical protein